MFLDYSHTGCGPTDLDGPGISPERVVLSVMVNIAQAVGTCERGGDNYTARSAQPILFL